MSRSLTIRLSTFLTTPQNIFPISSLSFVRSLSLEIGNNMPREYVIARGQSWVLIGFYETNHTEIVRGATCYIDKTSFLYVEVPHTRLYKIRLSPTRFN